MPRLGNQFFFGQVVVHQDINFNFFISRQAVAHQDINFNFISRQATLPKKNFGFVVVQHLGKSDWIRLGDKSRSCWSTETTKSDYQVFCWGSCMMVAGIAVEVCVHEETCSFSLEPVPISISASNGNRLAVSVRGKYQTIQTYPCGHQWPTHSTGAV